MSISKFLIVDTNNNKIHHAVESELDNELSLKVLKIMFDDHEVFELNNLNEKEIFDTSPFIDGKIYDPKPFDSWISNNGEWESPKKYPNDGKLYWWNESDSQWQAYSGTLSNL